jgi:DNA-binding transcriptional LysR family regulator
MKDDRLVEMRVFKAVVETGGFSAAAARLDASQPFVSKVVSNLERRLGCKLLHRSTRSQRMTTEGERFLLSCTRVLDAIEHAEAQVKDGDPMSELKVSAPLAFGLDQIVPRLPGFLDKYPRLSVHLSLSDNMVNLIDDDFDVAIRMGRLQDSSLVRRKLCHLHRIVVASPDYLKRYGQPVTPAGLENGQHNCLMWRGIHTHLNRWPFMINGHLDHVSARGNVQSDNGSSLYQLCLQGVGIMRLAEHLALPALRRGDLVPLLSDYVVRDDTAIYAVYLSEGPTTPRVRHFIDYYVDAFKTPPWQY